MSRFDWVPKFQPQHDVLNNLSQAIWKLDQPVEVNVAEDFNKRLLIALQGGPGTHNADRLLRLPGTVNWLNAQKREAGRQPALSFWMTKP